MIYLSSSRKLTLLLSLLLILLKPSLVAGQNLYFPPITGNTWDTLSPNTLGWCSNRIDSLYDYLETKNTKAFILLKEGKIVLEKYFGSFTQDSLWYWASAGKTLTAFTVGIAQQEGFLSIYDTTSHYLGSGWTSCTSDKEEKISIFNQLTMTSGLDDGVPDHYCTLPSCLQYLADAGTRWAYHNGPYTLLDGVIQSATGQTLNNYVTQKIKNPTGITGAFYPSGYNNVFVSKARSMARFGLLMLNKGKWNSTAIITDTTFFNQMVNTSQNFNLSYGYLWWLNGKSSFMVPGFQFTFPGSLFPNAPADMYAALGKNGQIINVVPSQNIVLVRMGDAPGVGEVPVMFNDTVWIKINNLSCNVSNGSINTNNKNLLIYPNPVKNEFTINTSENLLQIEIFDIRGNLVNNHFTINNDNRINVSELSEGIYFAKITTETNVVYHSKIIVRK
jgi:CubicO group peptidase (beta-lactamase class C family)